MTDRPPKSVRQSPLARRFADGLSSLRDRAAARLAGSRFNPSRFVVERFGLLSAALGVTLASAIYLGGGFHAIGMMMACFVALSVGDAWDNETRP